MLLNNIASNKKLFFVSVFSIVISSTSLSAKAVPQLYCPTPGLHDVDPRRSLMVTEQSVVANAISLRAVMKSLVIDAGVPGLTPKKLWKQWWDTQNTGPGLGLGGHCDDFTNAQGQATLNDFPLDCERNEGGEVSFNPFSPNSATQYIPIALVNRFDLAPANGANCGEYRVVFARKTGQGNSGERNLIIFEAVLDNPKPNCGLDGCRAIAKFWASLSDVNSPIMRAKMLRKFFLEGIPSAGVEPVISIENFSPGTGQIRTNQFLSGSNQQSWQLREFKLAELQTSAGNTVGLEVVQVTTKGTPWGELFDNQFSDPRTLPFMLDFLGEVDSLAEMQLKDITMNTNDIYNSGQSTAQGFLTESNYTNHFDSSSALAGQIQTQLGVLGSTLTPENIVNRARTQNCAGCHQLSNFDNLGGGLVWPPSLGFVHISEASTEFINGVEHFEISDALTNHFLPVREAIFERYLDNSCMPCLLPADESKNTVPSYLTGNFGGNRSATLLPSKSRSDREPRLSEVDAKDNLLSVNKDKGKKRGEHTSKENDLAVIVELVDGRYISPKSVDIMRLDLERKIDLPKENIAGTSRVH